VLAVINMKCVSASDDNGQFSSHFRQKDLRQLHERQYVECLSFTIVSNKRVYLGEIAEVTIEIPDHS